MESILFSTAYLPQIAWFVAYAQAGHCFMEQFENYQKQTPRTRTSIVGANGVQVLSIPVIRNHGTKTPIKDVLLDYHTQWQQVHWRAIEAAYGNSPFYEYYGYEFEPFYKGEKCKYLYDFNLQLIELCLKFLGISAPMEHSKEYLPTTLLPENITDAREHLPECECRKYYQVFQQKHGFVPNLSIIDLIFNEGPNALSVLLESALSLRGN